MVDYPPNPQLALSVDGIPDATMTMTDSSSRQRMPWLWLYLEMLIAAQQIEALKR